MAIVAVAVAAVSPPFMAAERAAAADGAAATAAASAAPHRPGYETVSLRGRVVWLAEALRRLYGLEPDADTERQTVALETAAGVLYPLIKDGRGRAFHKDPRLMGVDVELLVRRYEGAPVVQIIRVYTLKQDERGQLQKYELDYWCDICSISMFELKECECCQGPTRIRERLVGDAGEGVTPGRLSGPDR